MRDDIQIYIEHTDAAESGRVKTARAQGGVANVPDDVLGQLGAVVGELSKSMVSSFASALDETAPNEVEVEFGLELRKDVNFLWLLKLGGSGQLKVKLRWKRAQ